MKAKIASIVVGAVLGFIAAEGPSVGIWLSGAEIGRRCEAMGHKPLSREWELCVGLSIGRATRRILQVDAASAHSIEVVDGDTVKIDGFPWRLVGYDTPETYFAKCDEEYGAGVIAKQELAGLLRQAKKVEYVSEGRTDRYGRTLGHLYLDGRDVADIMVETGLARRYSGRTKRKGWCDEQ